MALNLSQKQDVVAEVAEVAAKAHSLIAAEYAGTTVSQMTAMRKKARETGVFLKVVKNTLAARAVTGTEYEVAKDSLVGPLLYAFSTEEPGAAGRLIKEFAKGNDKMLNNTRGIIATYLGVWRYLPDAATFSVSAWVQDATRTGWLFVTYRDDQMGMLRGLVASLLELGIVEGLSLSENQDRGLWFVFDEVDSLGKVSSLRSGLTKLRKYGGRCVLGLQTVSQLRETYGKDEAQTLLANLSTKLILRAGDNETAEYFSKELGEQDIDRLQMTTGQGTSSGGLTNPGQSSESFNTNYNMQRVRQAAIMSSEVLNLPDLQGFLKIPGQPVATVKIDYQAMPEVKPAYLS